jgi:C4-dicarboxylate-specific signal transduction histidine kinase
VLADKVQIQQVLLNLIRNAIEAIEGCDKRELVVSAGPAGDGMVAISVADTGTGIAPDMAGQLFQPFVTTKPHGTGVGLSISRTTWRRDRSQAEPGRRHDFSIHAASRDPGGGWRCRLKTPRYT